MLDFASTLSGFKEFLSCKNLHESCRLIVFVKYLVEKPISCLPTFQHADENRITPLHAAVNSGKVEVVKALLDYGADVEVSDC